MFRIRSNSIQVVVLLSTLFFHPHTGYEISSKDSQSRLSHQIDSNSSPRDQYNYHHYRRSDQNEISPQRQMTLNAIPSYSQKYQGWKPIISSRRLHTPGEKYSQYSSTTMASTSITNEASQTVTTTEPSPKMPTQHIKRKIINEDDIMRLHYGANDDETQTENPSSTEAKPKNTANKVEFKNQYHSQYRLDQMTPSTRQNPKNIYEIMDSNSPPTFKPIAQSVSREGNLDEIQTKDTRRWSVIDKDSNSVIYNGIDNKIPVDTFDTDGNEQVVKIHPSHLPATDKNQMDGTIQPIHVEPTKETSMESEYVSFASNFPSQKPSEKGGKFLGKPIVIAEQAESFPYFTAEYYRRLFDSFGRQDRSFDTTNKFSNDLDSTSNATSDRTDIKSENTIANCSSDSSTCKKNSNQSENQTSHRPRHKHRFNIFKFMGIDMKDLMPKTLRFNIYLIRKLLAQCYTELQDEDPSPIVCLKKITTKVLDNAIGKDIIKLTDNVSLVKENGTAVVEYESSRSSSASTDWLPSIVDKMAKLFSTHSLRVQLVNSQDDHKYQVEGRRRHYFRRVFPVIAGVYLFITAVLIPIVFQFMATMGGKSFVISKIALIFAVLSSVSKFLVGGESSQPHHHHHSPPPSYYPHPPPPHPPETPAYYEHPHQQWKKSDKKRVPINYSYYTVE